MSEERFKYIAFDGFEDNGEFITPHQVVELLNEYYEENMELKSKSKMIYERDAYKKLYEDLKEENKQLKRRISDVERLFEPITCTTLESDYNGVDCPKVKKPKLVRKDD